MIVAVRMCAAARVAVIRMAVVMIMRRVAVRPEAVAVIVDVFFRLAGGLGCASPAATFSRTISA